MVKGKECSREKHKAFKEFLNENHTYCRVEDPICLGRSCPQAPLQYQLSQHSHHEGQTAKAKETEACRSELQSQTPNWTIHTCWSTFTVAVHPGVSQYVFWTAVSLSNQSQCVDSWGKVKVLCFLFLCSIFYIQYGGGYTAVLVYVSV